MVGRRKRKKGKTPALMKQASGGDKLSKTNNAYKLPNVVSAKSKQYIML